MNNPLNNFINTQGILAENLWIFYTKAVGTGFTEAQAMELTKSYLLHTLTLANSIGQAKLDAEKGENK